MASFEGGLELVVECLLAVSTSCAVFSTAPFSLQLPPAMHEGGGGCRHVPILDGK